MQDPNEGLLIAGKKITAQIQNLLSVKQTPIVVAIDGGSGAGKSTLASAIEHEFNIALIPLDDFFAANIPDDEWDKFTVTEKLKNVFDWNRLRNDVIEPLLAGKPAKWYAFDFQLGLRIDGTYGMETGPKELSPTNVIVIEGAYSSSPEIADIVDLTVFIDVPIEERHARLEVREDHAFLEKWHQRWDEVELYFFTQVRPKSSFDIVVELK